MTHKALLARLPEKPPEIGLINMNPGSAPAEWRGLRQLSAFTVGAYTSYVNTSPTWSPPMRRLFMRMIRILRNPRRKKHRSHYWRAVTKDRRLTESMIEQFEATLQSLISSPHGISLKENLDSLKEYGIADPGRRIGTNIAVLEYVHERLCGRPRDELRASGYRATPRYGGQSRWSR